MKYLSKLSLIITAAVLLSCGDNKKENEEQIIIGEQETTQSTTTTSTPEVSDGEVIEVSLTGNDQMQFNKNEIRVKAGQTVRLTFAHVAKWPKM